MIPSAFSARAMRADMVCWLMPSSRAALEIEPARAAAKSASSSATAEGYMHLWYPSQGLVIAVVVARTNTV